jgi:hypothetical protein
LNALGQAVSKKRLQPKIVAANEKVDAAKEVVDKVAGGKHGVTTTEVLTGVLGTGGTVSVVKQGIDSVNEASQSFGQLLTTVGPWVLLALVVIGIAAYVIIDKRRDRLAAQAVQQVL